MTFLHSQTKKTNIINECQKTNNLSKKNNNTRYYYILIFSFAIRMQK